MPTPAKETKTEAELREIIMAEVRNRPECQNISGVGFIRDGNQNWRPTFVYTGNRHSYAPLNEFLAGLQAKYGLE